MKGNVLLVTSCGTDLVSIAGEAARKTGRSLRKADSCRQTFEILTLGLEDVDVAIVDIGASLHSLAILEALNYSDTAPPVIALIEVDEAEATPIVQRHGAAACLKKPFGADELATLIEKVCASACRNKTLTCDKWGHVRTPNVRSSQRKLIPNMVASSPWHDCNPSVNSSLFKGRGIQEVFRIRSATNTRMPRNAIIAAIT